MNRTSEGLTSVNNFRDLGGARTGDGRCFRRGLVYRAGLLSELTPRERELLEGQLGIRTVIDLRRVREDDSAGLAHFDAARVLEMPLTPQDVRVLLDKRPEVDAVVSWYRRQLDVSRESIKAVFDVFESFGRDPLVYHCHAGKDRTGVLSAVLLGGLGVVDEDIIDDYSRSRASEDDAWFSTLPEIFREARPEVMQRLLDRVREDFGSMRAYLELVGVSSATMQTLESRYLTDQDG